MTKQTAIRELPNYAGAELPLPETPIRHRIISKEEFERRYGLLLILAAAFTIYSVLLSAWVSHKTEKRVMADKEEYAAQAVEQYKKAQQEETSRQYFLSGEASREAYINQAIDAGARFIAEESDDTYKCTKLGVAIARMMNPKYPDTIQEVIEQPNQWIRNSHDSNFTQHDRDLSEKLLRPYLESGMIPNGLTAKMVFFNTETGTARDSYENTATMNTWRYQ